MYQQYEPELTIDQTKKDKIIIEELEVQVGSHSQKDDIIKDLMARITLLEKFANLKT